MIFLLISICSNPPTSRLQLQPPPHPPPPRHQSSHRHPCSAFPSANRPRPHPPHLPHHPLIRIRNLKLGCLTFPLYPPHPLHCPLTHHHLQRQRRPLNPSVLPPFTWQRSRLMLPSLGRVKKKTVRVEVRESSVSGMSLWCELRTLVLLR